LLKDNVIIVTGGGGFLGSNFCLSIAENGANVIIADINLESAQKVADEINAKDSGSAQAVPLDITDEQSIKRLISDIINKYGHIDALVNNAYPRNSTYGKKLEDVTYNSFCENVNLHLGGYFLMSQKFGILFREQGYGNIVNMSSIYGTLTPRFEIYEGTPMTTPVEYVAIKSAIIQLTRYFAEYFKKDGIRVNSLSPGGILDAQPKSFLEKYNEKCGKKGMLEPNDVSGSLVYLLSDKSKYVTGQNLIVDDGFSL